LISAPCERPGFFLPSFKILDVQAFSILSTFLSLHRYTGLTAPPQKGYVNYAAKFLSEPAFFSRIVAQVSSSPPLFVLLLLERTACVPPRYKAPRVYLFSPPRRFLFPSHRSFGDPIVWGFRINFPLACWNETPSFRLPSPFEVCCRNNVSSWTPEIALRLLPNPCPEKSTN